MPQPIRITHPLNRRSGTTADTERVAGARNSGRSRNFAKPGVRRRTVHESPARMLGEGNVPQQLPDRVKCARRLSARPSRCRSSPPWTLASRCRAPEGHVSSARIARRPRPWQAMARGPLLPGTGTAPPEVNESVAVSAAVSVVRRRC